MRKSKPTVQHLITGYLISTGTTRENNVATRLHLLLSQSSRRLILLNRKSIQSASCIPKESTRVSSAALFAKHSEHLQLLPTKTTKKRANTSKILPNEELSMPVTQTSHLLGLPPVLHPIKAMMGSPELWLSSPLVLIERRDQKKSHLLGLPPVLHPIKTRMGSPELWLESSIGLTPSLTPNKG